MSPELYPPSPNTRMEVEISIERRVEDDGDGRAGEGVDGLGGVELDADGVPIVAEGSSSGDKVENVGPTAGGGHGSSWVASGR